MAVSVLVGTLERLLQDRFQILLLGVEGWQSHAEAVAKLAQALQSLQSPFHRIREGFYAVQRATSRGTQLRFRKEPKAPTHRRDKARLPSSPKPSNAILTRALSHMEKAGRRVLFERWKQSKLRLGISYVEIDATKKLATCLLLQRLSHHSLLSQSLSQWKCAVAAVRKRGITKLKTGIFMGKLMNVARERERWGWRQVIRYLSHRTHCAGRLFQACTALYQAYMFGASFAQLKKYAKWQLRKRSTLLRVLQILHEKQTVQCAVYLGRLSKQLSFIALSKKRRNLRYSQGARLLRACLKNITVCWEKEAFDTLRLKYCLEGSGEIEARSALLTKALRRCKLALAANTLTAFQRWKATVKEAELVGIQRHFAAILGKLVKKAAWTALKACRAVPRRSATPHCETRVKAVGRRERVRRYATPDPTHAQKLVNEVLQSQAAIQTRVEAILRATANRPKFSTRVVQVVKYSPEARSTIGRFISLLENSLTRSSFSVLRSTATEPLTPTWDAMSRQLTKKSHVIQFVTQRLVAVLNDQVLKVMREAMEVLRGKARRLLSLQDLQIVEALLRHRKQLALTSVMETFVQRWRQSTREAALRNRKRTLKLCTSLRRFSYRFERRLQHWALRTLSSLPLSARRAKQLCLLHCKRQLSVSFHQWKETVLFLDTLHAARARRVEQTRRTLHCRSPIIEGRKSLVLHPPNNIHQYIDDVVGVTNQGAVEASYSTAATLEGSWAQDLFAPFSPPKQRHLVKTALLPPRPPMYHKPEVTYRSLGVFSALKRSSEGNDLEYMREGGGDEDYDEFL